MAPRFPHCHGVGDLFSGRLAVRWSLGSQGSALLRSIVAHPNSLSLLSI
jgi:hypothetical protein